MLFSFADRAEVSGTRKTADGYLVADAKICRTGIYRYGGDEMGRPDLPFVDVFRPEASIFDATSMASLAHKPLTNDHPAEDVSPANWKQLAIGMIGDEVKRDGDFIRVPMMLTDAQAIADYEAGKVELSPGYRCEISFADGEHDGKPYQAVAGPPVYNHTALVDRARGGSHCRIGDAWPTNPTPKPKDKSMPIMLDGLKVDIADAEAVQAAFTKLQGQVADAVTAKAGLETQVATLTTQVSTKDADIVTLKAQLEDAKVTPQKMRDAAAAFARTIEQAKKLAPTATITDAMDEAAIKKAVVSAKLGDAAKDWTDAQVDTSFATLAASIGDTQADPLRRVIADPKLNLTDAIADERKALDEANDFNSWRNKKAA